MKRLSSLLLVIAATLASASSLMAQQKRVSPHDAIGAPIDGNRVTILYGRPYSKDHMTGEIRKIWGSLVPYGKVWRTGADEPTYLLTQKTILFGSTEIPEGIYSLWTLPNEDGTAKLIFNKHIGQWGTQYDKSMDFASVDLTKSALDKTVDQFTMAVEKNPSGGGVIKLMWENTQYSAAYTVKK
jgi:hypothetical protein